MWCSRGVVSVVWCVVLCWCCVVVCMVLLCVVLLFVCGVVVCVCGVVVCVCCCCCCLCVFGVRCVWCDTQKTAVCRSQPASVCRFKTSPCVVAPCPHVLSNSKQPIRGGQILISPARPRHAASNVCVEQRHNAVPHLKERQCHTSARRWPAASCTRRTGSSQQRQSSICRRPPDLPCLLRGVWGSRSLLPSSPWFSSGAPLCPAHHCALRTITAPCRPGAAEMCWDPVDFGHPETR